MHQYLKIYAPVALALSVFASIATAGPVKSVGIMTFADTNTLVVADWRAGEIHALHLAPAASVAAKPFNLKDVSASIASALRSQPDKLHFEDLAFRPGAELAYVTVSVDRGDSVPSPALVSVDAAGKVSIVDLAKLIRTSVEIKDRPAADKSFWRDVPEASYTVTDLVFHEDKLYVAGLSNAKFASTLRVYDFPFTSEATVTSIEMYHAVHNQNETRAPIRTMTIVTLNGEPSLVAAYTCTPLVTIPLKDLKDGARITGKTIAELGWGSAPVDMVTFDAGQGPTVLLINSHKAADLMPVAAIASASAQPGLTTPIKWPNEPLLGLKSSFIPMAGIAQLGNQDKDFLGALRRNPESGAMELVSIRKGAFLRLSDFINEYDFADFKYGPNDGFRGVHQMLRTDEGYPDLAKRAAP
ncbi:MAG: hypothetical protein ACRER2_01170 [Methylococcales bacterium]